jgi:DNA-binding NarL/FixJ family response regulator
MKSIRVLIVDDLLQVREGLATMLALAGNASERKIEVVGFADNGSEALRQAQKILPDVILMDLEMPGLDGYEATRRIKAELPAMHVIILSIHNDSEAQQHARAAGADDFVTKGDPYEILLKAVLDNQETVAPTTSQEGEKS